MAKIVKTNSQKSVENGIKVLKTAIKNNVSVSEASRQHNFGRNYVSDVKARLATNYKNKNVDKETYTAFKSLVKTYESI